MGDTTFVAPDDYAIIVGINRYRNGIEPLRGAVNDAKLFHEWLIDETGGGLDPDRAKLIVSPDNGPYDPSREDIETEIMEFFERLNNTGAPVGRRLYLFFAGHGVAPRDGDDCSLIAANSFLNPYWVLTGRMTADRIFRQPMFQEVVLFMACCRDIDTQVTYSGLPDPGQPLPDAKYFYGLAVKWAKRAIEKELPHPRKADEPNRWQSIFVHALLKGLQSAVDDEGQVTSVSLKNFVKKQVKELLPPDDPRLPKFFFEEEDPPIVFKRAAPPVPVVVAGAAEGIRIAADGGTPGRRRRRGARSDAGDAGQTGAAHQAGSPESGLVPVEVVLSNDATEFEVLDGITLTKLEPPRERTPQGGYKIYLRPSLYAFRIPGGDPKPTRVLGEALRVVL